MLIIYNYIYIYHMHFLYVVVLYIIYACNIYASIFIS